MFLIVVKYHSYQSAANLRIYQNIFKGFSLKIAFSKNAFSKLLPKNLHFQNTLSKNCFLKKKKKISKVLVKKSLPQKIHFQNCFLKKLTSYL